MKWQKSFLKRKIFVEKGVVVEKGASIDPFCVVCVLAYIKTGAAGDTKAAIDLDL